MSGGGVCVMATLVTNEQSQVMATPLTDEQSQVMATLVTDEQSRVMATLVTNEHSRGVATLVTHLLYKHEDLSSAASTLRICFLSGCGVAVASVIPEPGGETEGSIPLGFLVHQ